jgi:hypothetical protein
MMKRAIFVVLALTAVVAGCASITKGSHQMISISSNVDGADLYLDGMKIGTTPFTGEVPKNKKALTVEKAGYRTETIVLSKSLEGMFWGNIITGGTLGSLTDFATGAAYAYAPASYQVDLKSNDQSATDFGREYTARRFAMVYIDDIARDLGAGSGEYLASLCQILGDAGTSQAIRGAFQTAGGDPVAFGNAVVALL